MFRPYALVLAALIGSFFMGNSRADDARLTGRWQGQLGEQIISLEIVSNNQLVFDGVPGYYRQFPGLIRMGGEYGPVDYPYRFEDEVLVMTFPEGYQLRFVKEGDIATSGREQIAARQSGTKDNQLRALLLSSGWCSFSLTDRSVHPERVHGMKRLIQLRFHPDGTYWQKRHSGTYSSGYGGTVAGQYGSASSGHWRVQNGRLFVSEGGGPLKPVQLDITFDPGGSPILYYFGSEYLRCD